MSYLSRFKDDWIRRWKAQDTTEKIIGIGFSSIVLVMIIFLSEQQFKSSARYVMIVGVFIIAIVAERLRKSKNDLSDKNQIIESQKEEIETSYKNLELLNSISNEITSSLNLERVMNLIYKNVSALMDASFFSSVLTMNTRKLFPLNLLL